MTAHPVGKTGFPGIRECLARCVSGEVVPWRALNADRDEVLAACDHHGVTALVYRQLQRSSDDWDWPGAVTRELAVRSRLVAVVEEVRRRETMAVLEVLGTARIRPILLKGTPLAYTLYETPSLRPRADTDLLVPREQTEDVRHVLEAQGYRATAFCAGEYVFCQFELRRSDELGVVHAFDVHWKISTQSTFADVLTYGELAGEALPVPALGLHARTAPAYQALLLACVHPAMHHRNDDCLVWSMDIHRLVDKCSLAEMGAFAVLAVAKGVAVICAHELRRAAATFGTSVPSDVMSYLEMRIGREPSAVYLEPSRRWHHELVSNVRGLRDWRSRLALLREIALPPPGYMRRAYGVEDGWFSAAALPVLYLHRGASGAWKVLTRRK
jgi:hypothetical protein